MRRQQPRIGGCGAVGVLAEDTVSLITAWQTWQRPTLPRLKTKYHWRKSFSRPSSEWDRVQQLCHNHQVGKGVIQVSGVGCQVPSGDRCNTCAQQLAPKTSGCWSVFDGRRGQMRRSGRVFLTPDT